MFDIVGLMALVLLSVLCGWLAMRARLAKNAVVKWAGGGLSGLLTVASTAAIIVALVGMYRLNVAPYHYPAVDVKVAGTPEQLARGERLSRLYCPFCHSPTGEVPLVGQNFGKGGPPIGTLYAPNLTRAGEIRDWSDGEVIRGIREGVHKSGRPLIIMPSEVFRSLSDSDVQALVAYLRTQPPVEPNTPPTRLNVIAALLVGAGMFRTSAQVPITQSIVAPTQGVSAEYGKYLVSILGCSLCHGANLAGRPSGGHGPPAGPNLTVIVPAWNEAGFVTTLRTGIDPSGRTLNEAMPWKYISSFASDSDLKAIYAYLHDLPPSVGSEK